MDASSTDAQGRSLRLAGGEMTGLARFQIDTTFRRGRIVVNDQDITRSMRVRSLVIRADANDLPILELECMAEGVIEGEGIVYVHTPAPEADDRQAIVAFLSGVDPEAFERAVLDRTDWGSGSTMQQALQVLVEWAGGDRDWTRPYGST